MRQPQQAGPALAPLNERIRELMMLGFVKMKEGVPGFDYAAYICIHVEGGREVYDALYRVGAAGVMAGASMDPQASKMINDPAVRPQCEKFLSDFFSFDPDASGDEAEESEPADASA